LNKDFESERFTRSNNDRLSRSLKAVFAPFWHFWRVTADGFRKFTSVFILYFKMCFSLMPHVLDELATATSAKKVDEDPQQSRCGVLRRLRVTCGRSDRETGWLQWV